jgi:hypothetical protein
MDSKSLSDILWNNHLFVFCLSDEAQKNAKKKLHKQQQKFGMSTPPKKAISHNSDFFTSSPTLYNDIF